MTAIAVAGDLHLGSGRALASDRPADHDRTLSLLADSLALNSVETLLLTGDIFHRPRPTPETLLIFRRFTRRLEALGIQTVAITGNQGHDIENAERPCALELFSSDWLRVSRTPELIRAAGDVAVCTLPSTPVSKRVAAHDGGDRSAIYDETVELLLGAARDLRAEVPAGWPSILIGHWSIAGAHLPNGLPVADIDGVVLPLEGLVELGYDACVFGHIHNPECLSGLLSGESFVAYTGTPHVVDFGETHVDHGFWLLDVGGGGADALYVSLEDRRFVTVDIDLVNDEAFSLASTGEFDETDVIMARLAEQLPLEGAVVRLRYRATEEQHRRVDRAAILKFLELADKVHGPTWEPVRANRARVEVDGDGLTDHEALQMWVDAVRLGEEQGKSVHLLLDRIDETVTA